MKTTLPFLFFVLLACCQMNARPTEPFSYTNCLLCSIPQNLTVQNLSTSSATLAWDAVAGATKYNIEVENSQNSSGSFYIDTTTTATSFALNGLQTGKTYKFKVRARCGGDHSDWSEWFFFFTASDSTSTPVDTTGTSICAAPTQLSSAVAGATATLSWNQVGAASLYYLEVEDEQNQPGNFHLELQVTGTSYELSGLVSNVLYKFKVSTHCDSSSHGPWSDWQFFNGNTDSTGTGGNNSGSCGKPTGLVVTGIGAHEVTLHWVAVAGAQSYTLEIERYQNNPSNPWQVTQVVDTNAFQLTGLQPNTRYKFKVRANCADGHSDWSNWRKFKTDHAFLTPQFIPSPTLEQRNDDPDAGEPAFALQVWPNPVRTTASIRLSELQPGTVDVCVLDFSGRNVQNRSFQIDGTEVDATLSFQDIPEGCYLLRIQNGSDVKSAKLVVIH